jgi:RNA polymerase sigma-70 factor (ECF subfamily)
VAYSIALRHLERKRIPLAEQAAAGDDDSTPLENISDEFDLEAACADADMARSLHAAIEALPPLQRTVLTLYHLEDASIAQIAKITGLPDGTIKSHLFRSRLRLRETLEPRVGVVT